MTETNMPKQASPTVAEYIGDNFKPADRIAILALNRNLGETTQRITTAQKAASPEFQAWLLRVMGRNIRFLKSDLETFRASFKQEMENA